MNVESNLESMEDELNTMQTLLEDTNTRVTPASNPSVSQSATKKARNATSEVWNYFEKLGQIEGVEKCKCKGCGKMYTCKGVSGTNHLRRHIPKFNATPKYHDVGVMLDNKASLLKQWKYGIKAYREALARCIIKHDLPYSYAEYEGVLAINKLLNPDFNPTSRNTAKYDCNKVYLSDKAKLKSQLNTIPGRICLTSDVWTTVTAQGYMTVTAHYVDENWKLNSKLLSFVHLECAHTGLELSGKLLGVLKDWGIDNKIFSLTLDNASSNDSMIKILKERLNLQNALLCKGEYFHVRCCAHILNLIVQEGLKAAGDHALHKIRENVKYVRVSDGRLREFKKCVEEVHLNDVGGGFLRLDVSTRWNATYMMLKSAIKYRRAFTNLGYIDRSYKFCPTNEEWEIAGKICEFLAPFYDITNLISGSSYSTSNLYFIQVAIIEMGLNKNLTCEDEVIKDMAARMKVKFDKYWNEYCVTLAFGCVFDPKEKLNFISFCYKRLYPYDHEERVNRVKVSMYNLFGEYLNQSTTSRSSLASNSRDIQSHPMPSGNFSTSILEAYYQEIRQNTSNDGKSQLDIYLSESCLVGDDIGALQYWKLNKHRFPQLASMACDILSIPITTVASESSFSIGGRILHKYRNCLLPENVEALICTRNWNHDFNEVGPSSDEKDIEEIQMFTEQTSQGENTTFREE